MFLPVYRSSVELFLEFLMQSGQLPQEIDPKLPVSAKETLFDRAAGGIFRMHVDSLFLSLIAAGMIKMTMQNNALQCALVFRGGLALTSPTIGDFFLYLATNEVFR